MALGALVEKAVGPINGANTVFTVSTMYVPGSTQVWLNGLLVRKDWANGWKELGANKIQMKEAPIPGDVVQVFFRPI
jgi:hypothetical protein